MLLTGGFDAPVRKIVSLLAHGVTTRKGEQQFARKELAKYIYDKLNKYLTEQS